MGSLSSSHRLLGVSQPRGVRKLARPLVVVQFELKVLPARPVTVVCYKVQARIILRNRRDYVILYALFRLRGPRT